MIQVNVRNFIATILEQIRSFIQRTSGDASQAALDSVIQAGAKLSQSSGNFRSMSKPESHIIVASPESCASRDALYNYWFLLVELADTSSGDEIIIGRRDPLSGYTPDVDLYNYYAAQNGIETQHLIVNTRAKTFAVHSDVDTPTYHNDVLVLPGKMYELGHNDGFRIGRVHFAVHLIPPRESMGKAQWVLMKSLGHDTGTLPTTDDLLERVFVRELKIELPVWIAERAQKLAQEEQVKLDKAYEAVLAGIEARLGRTLVRPQDEGEAYTA